MPGHRAVPITPWSPTTRQGRTGTETVTNIGNFIVTGTSTPSWVFQDLVIQHTFQVRGGSAVAPTIAVGAGAGSGGAATFPDPVNVNDMLMAQVQIVTGTSPAANTSLAVITFGTAYHEILSDSVFAFFMPNDSISGALGLFVTPPTSGFTSITIKSTAVPAASTTYNFGVLVLSK